ncbi:hypothetical protein [Niallia sp. 01092]|uniref:hypothetical protein n=1 Tax=unclassified Niallia TaxID=2837522 RepID=UPI003FD2F690
MIFGELICKLRGYHKFNYYYSGQCITCGKIRKEYENKDRQQQQNVSPTPITSSEYEQDQNNPSR